jgi:hypothetical protein
MTPKNPIWGEKGIVREEKSVLAQQKKIKTYRALLKRQYAPP